MAGEESASARGICPPVRRPLESLSTSPHPQEAPMTLLAMNEVYGPEFVRDHGYVIEARA
jgi:hypothetical protein